MSTLKHYLMIFLVSMVPLIELRGAIPYAIGFIEAGEPLNLTVCYLIAIVGNMLPVPFIYLFARKVLEWGKDKKVIGKFFNFCLEKGEKGGQKLQSKAGRGLYYALFCSWVFRFRVPVHGPEHWLHQFWIWISRRVYLLLYLVLF